MYSMYVKEIRKSHDLLFISSAAPPQTPSEVPPTTSTQPPPQISGELYLISSRREICTPCTSRRLESHMTYFLFPLQSLLKLPLKFYLPLAHNLPLKYLVSELYLISSGREISIPMHNPGFPQLILYSSAANELHALNNNIRNGCIELWRFLRRYRECVHILCLYITVRYM